MPKPQFVPGLLAKLFHHQRLEAAVYKPILQRTQPLLVTNNLLNSVSQIDYTTQQSCSAKLVLEQSEINLWIIMSAFAVLG